MLSQRTIESLVGLFLIAAIVALIVLAFKVSGLTTFFKAEGYQVTADFDDIGQLKIRAPVKMSGVVIGEVDSIALDPQTFKAVVTLRIHKNVNDIPSDSSASILTAGLLGDNYIEVVPMYAKEVLKNGSEIQYTHSAMILEKLIGQLIYKLGNTNSNSSENENNQTNNQKGTMQ